jgi:hypothetical protein
MQNACPSEGGQNACLPEGRQNVKVSVDVRLAKSTSAPQKKAIGLWPFVRGSAAIPINPIYKESVASRQKPEARSIHGRLRTRLLRLKRIWTHSENPGGYLWAAT